MCTVFVWSLVWIDLTDPEGWPNNWFSSNRISSPPDETNWIKSSFSSNKPYQCGVINYKKKAGGSYEALNIEAVNCFQENYCVCMNCRGK